LFVGGLFLLPAAGRLAQWLPSRETQTLPEPAVSFVLLLNDRPIPSDAVIAAASIAGAVLVLIGLRVLR
jgi:hypothetical protein